jgi:hypothetical protein
MFLSKRSNRSLHHSSKLFSVNFLFFSHFQAGCRGAIRTPVSGFKVQSPAARRPGIMLSTRLLSCTAHTKRPIIDVVPESSAIRTRTAHQFAVIAAAIAVELRCKLNFKAFEINRLCTHKSVAARRIELPSQPGVTGRILAVRRRRLLYAHWRNLALKTQSPRFMSEAQKNHALLICPRYMNVPFPAPCHVAVAGVGKQSV